MATASDVASTVARKMAALELAATKGQRQALARAAKVAAAAMQSEVPADAGGNHSLSGWRRGREIPIKVTVRELGDDAVAVWPSKPAIGPMRVLEQGRNQGNASGFAGPGVNRTTGETARTKKGAVRKVRARRAKRWNGYTAGKGTWSRGRAAASKKSPIEFRKHSTSAFVKAFRS